mmetsp:Transcript_51415/g.116941  ORF Transcript_51415/g.116941 Transcript_51415/m.116941 type:complete len:291 (-) Transcript_51415:4736-5608(-)
MSFPTPSTMTGIRAPSTTSLGAYAESSCDNITWCTVRGLHPYAFLLAPAAAPAAALSAALDAAASAVASSSASETGAACSSPSSSSASAAWCSSAEKRSRWSPRPHSRGQQQCRAPRRPGSASMAGMAICTSGTPWAPTPLGSAMSVAPRPGRSSSTMCRSSRSSAESLEAVGCGTASNRCDGMGTFTTMTGPKMPSCVGTPSTESDRASAPVGEWSSVSASSIDSVCRIRPCSEAPAAAAAAAGPPSPPPPCSPCSSSRACRALRHASSMARSAAGNWSLNEGPPAKKR